MSAFVNTRRSTLYHTLFPGRLIEIVDKEFLD